MITSIKSVVEFQQLLQNNKGLFIIKFSATWCGPCKLIEQDVHKFFTEAPSNVQCAMIDIDECPVIYGFLKTKKMVNGVPALLCYYKGNVNYVPDDFVIGANKNELYMFFERCRQQVSSTIGA